MNGDDGDDGHDIGCCDGHDNDDGGMRMMKMAMIGCGGRSRS